MVFIGGVDAVDGSVRIKGWEGEAAMEDRELARQAGELGMSGIIYTNISRDGTLSGPDVARTNRIAEASGLPVVLSGGIDCF